MPPTPRRKPAILDLEHFLPYRLSVLSNTVSLAIAAEYEQRFQLSITEWRVMAVLARYADIAAREVAERTAMDKVAVSRAVARLLGAGRIERDVADHDKRQSVLRLTDAGHAIYAKVAPLALQHESRLLAALDATERDALERILAKLWQIERSTLAG